MIKMLSGLMTSFNEETYIRKILDKVETILLNDIDTDYELIRSSIAKSNHNMGNRFGIEPGRLHWKMDLEPFSVLLN